MSLVDLCVCVCVWGLKDTVFVSKKFVIVCAGVIGWVGVLGMRVIGWVGVLGMCVCLRKVL